MPPFEEFPPARTSTMNSIPRLIILLMLIQSSSVLVPAITSVAPAAEQFRVEIQAGPERHEQVPITVPIRLPNSLQTVDRVELVGPDQEKLVGQITRPSLLATDSSPEARELVFIVPTLKANETRLYKVQPAPSEPETEGHFSWDDNEGVFSQLSYDDRPILRYMYAAPDTSSPEALEKTVKVFHHVFDPKGEQIVTKGPGGQFSHHRGLFYGFNRISYGDKQADTWHCRKGESQQHVKTLAIEAGPVLGRHRVAINWHGRDGEVFAKELREMTVYHLPGGHLIEFASQLTSTEGPVRLDGDPQHAGFQFRASQEVAGETKAQTYYLRPDGRGQPGETRNWSPDKPDHRNLPWNAQSFVLGDQRFTCCYLDHPGNPKPARYSERDYGRFGSYFEYDLNDGHSLPLNYRVWLQSGEMDVPSVAAHQHNFVSPPQAKIITRP